MHFARHELAGLRPHPCEIRPFLQAEIDLLHDIVIEGMSMIDAGCRTGRHLTMLRNHLRTGVEVAYQLRKSSRLVSQSPVLLPSTNRSNGLSVRGTKSSGVEVQFDSTVWSNRRCSAGICDLDRPQLGLPLLGLPVPVIEQLNLLRRSGLGELRDRGPRRRVGLAGNRGEISREPLVGQSAGARRRETAKSPRGRRGVEKQAFAPL